jgi:rhodanese-related sulfurtransferase
MGNDKTTTSEITKITVDDAKGRLDRDEPLVFVDVRNPKAWAESDVKLPGAIRVPADAIDQHIQDLPQDRPIITYCT